jgi:hypothetical protein
MIISCFCGGILETIYLLGSLGGIAGIITYFSGKCKRKCPCKCHSKSDK